MAATNDSNLAAHLALEAGAALSALWRSTDSPRLGPLGDLADEIATTSILRTLEKECPTDCVLSEGTPDQTARLTAKRVWIIDPLDGTREFVEGRMDWAVHVALWESGQLVAGSVFLPCWNLLLPRDYYLRGRVANGEKLRVVVSRTRVPEVAREVATTLGAELVPLGSAGVKAVAVILGIGDIYIHDGGQFEWDSAAPAAVAQDAGMHVSRLDGSPLHYNSPDPYIPDLLICRKDLASTVIKWRDR